MFTESLFQLIAIVMQDKFLDNTRTVLLTCFLKIA